MKLTPLQAAYLGFGVIGAAVFGAFAYQQLQPAPSTAAVPALRPLGALPLAAAQPESNAVPERRPEFTLHDLDGKPHALSAWDGKPLIVNFWATWCAPCRREIPLLNRLQHEFSPKGFEVIGIAVDFADDVRAFKKSVAIDYPLLVGEDDGLEAARGFGVETMAFPFTAFIDAAGRVLLVHLGELHENQARAILGVVARVDAGALAAGAARTEIKAALAALPATPAASH
ncbi:MAG: TlpA disulfide reductase family protein, partial [Proteobacteria bacterium]|nr:TlpA disulfide reductase family protein [Pseudomonadota bacterium]